MWVSKLRAGGSLPDWFLGIPPLLISSFPLFVGSLPLLIGSMYLLIGGITVIFPRPCTCTILQYLSPKLQIAITHSILNQFFSFLGCVLAFIQTRCIQIYRA